MIFFDGRDEHLFMIKLCSATDSFRLENEHLKRSIFIGKHKFNNLFQFVRNEYGHNLGKILYSDHQMLSGVARTELAEIFRFRIEEANTVNIFFEPENVSAQAMKASISLKPHQASGLKHQIQFMMPCMLAAFILVGEIATVRV